MPVPVNKIRLREKVCIAEMLGDELDEEEEEEE